MKKTIATLLVAGALAAAGMSASAAVSASGGNSGQGSVVAVDYWPTPSRSNRSQQTAKGGDRINVQSPPFVMPYALCPQQSSQPDRRRSSPRKVNLIPKARSTA